MFKHRDHLNLIRTIGAEILASPEFQEAHNQTHHIRGTVGAHMLNTAYYSVCVCRLLNRFGISTNTEELIISCLCHDLGIVNNRGGKKVADARCCKEHPIASLPIARSLNGYLTARQEDTIRTHMWPLCEGHPHYREGYILTMIDKYCAVLEFTGILKPSAITLLKAIH